MEPYYILFIVAALSPKLMPAVTAGPLTLGSLQNTKCQEWEQVCVMDGTCCRLGEQVCSRRSNTCEDVFQPDDDRKDLCCQVFNGTSTDTREGLDKACNYLYGNLTGWQQTCLTEAPGSTNNQGHVNPYMIGFIVLLPITVTLLILLLCCSRRFLKRRRKRSKQEISQIASFNRKEKTKASQQLLPQRTTDQNASTSNEGAMPYDNRHQHHSGVTHGRPDTIPLQQSARLAAASPNLGAERREIRAAQRETVLESDIGVHGSHALSPGQVKSQQNREIIIDATTPHDEQSIIAPSGKRYE